MYLVEVKSGRDRLGGEMILLLTLIRRSIAMWFGMALCMSLGTIRVGPIVKAKGFPRYH